MRYYALHLNFEVLLIDFYLKKNKDEKISDDLKK